MILRIIIFCLIIYLIVAITIASIQRKLIYHPIKGTINANQIHIKGMQLLKLKTDDGLTLSALYYPAKNKATIVYFHGNAGNILNSARRLTTYINKGYGVFLVSYRGFLGSQGHPSEQGLYIDGRTGIKELEHLGVKPACMVIYGKSLGSGVAVELASEYKVGALVLQSAFSSLTDIAKRRYPFLPVSLMLRDKFDSIDKIQSVAAPKLFLHGDVDRIVPEDSGKKLYVRAKQPKQWHTFHLAGHNNIPNPAKIVIDFLKKQQVCQKHN